MISSWVVKSVINVWTKLDNQNLWSSLIANFYFNNNWLFLQPISNYFLMILKYFSFQAIAFFGFVIISLLSGLLFYLVFEGPVLAILHIIYGKLVEKSKSNNNPCWSHQQATRQATTQQYDTESQIILPVLWMANYDTLMTLVQWAPLHYQTSCFVFFCLERKT